MWVTIWYISLILRSDCLNQGWLKSHGAIPTGTGAAPITMLDQPFVHSPLGYFLILPTVNNATLNIEVHVAFWISVLISFRYIPRNGKPG